MERRKVRLNHILLLVVCGSLGAGMVLPIFDDKSWLQQHFFSDDFEPNPVGTNVWDWDNFTAPPGSFGIGSYSRKYPNATYLRDLINSNVQVDLEYRLPGQSNWNNGNQYMTIQKEWVNNSFYKYTFIFDNPVDDVDGRITFVCNKQVLSYVEVDDWVMYVNYSVPGGVYRLVMDFSDISHIPGMIINKGVQGGLAYVRFRKDNIPIGIHKWDPTFGNSAGTGWWYMAYSTSWIYFSAINATPATSGTADKLTFKTGSIWNSDLEVQGVLYEWVDDSSNYAGNAIAYTEVKDIPSGSTSTEFDLNFSGSPSVTGGTSYYLAVCPVEMGNGHCYITSADNNWCLYDDDSSPYTNITDDPKTGESKLNNEYPWIYCTYTEGGAANTAPTITNPVIWNTTSTQEWDLNAVNTDVCRTPTQINFTLGDVDVDNMNWTLYTNASGTWKTVNGSASGVTNGTYNATNTSWIDSFDTTYYLRLNVSDGEGGWDNDTYSFTTGSEYPTIVINFAGNLSDDGGPSWRPPGESVALAGDWSDGYYANSSRQGEDWIYINISISGNAFYPTDVWVNWLNGTAWTNYTHALSDVGGDYWEYNTSGNIQTAPGYDYSFDLVINTSVTNITEWNKVGMSGETVTRRYVQLNHSTPINISYTPYYFYILNESYLVADLSKRDALNHDQGTDGLLNDTGYLFDNIPTDTLHDRFCGNFVSYWFEEPVYLSGFEWENAYIHAWWNTSTGDLTGGVDSAGIDYSHTRLANTITEATDVLGNYSTYATNGYSNITYLGNVYTLEAQLCDFDSHHNFTDNSVYEMRVTLGEDGSLPKVISNRSFTSFLIFNVPDNATLNASHADTDSDGLSDWNELYLNHTNPFVADTDGDGNNDLTEYNDGTDPNNYTDFTEHRNWQNILSGYVTGGNITTANNIFNGYVTGGNASAQIWQSIFSGYVTGGNESEVWQQVFAGYVTGGNVTPANITITNPFPENDSNIKSFTPVVRFTLTNLAGGLMNYSIFYGNSTNNCTTLLANASSLGNGTYSYDDYYTAVDYDINYFWRVQADDGSTFVNETYNFEVGGTMNVGFDFQADMYLFIFWAILAFIIVKGRKPFEIILATMFMILFTLWMYADVTNLNNQYFFYLGIIMIFIGFAKAASAETSKKNRKKYQRFR